MIIALISSNSGIAMKRFQHILYMSLGVNDETAGLRQALSLAINNSAKLTILVMTPKLPANLEDYREKFEAAVINDMRASVRDTAKTINIENDAVDPTITLEYNTTPATRTIQTVLRDGHDLVIKEAALQEDKKGFRAIDMDLLRKCPCPVWLCRRIDKPRQDINVAVAIDPDDEEKGASDLSKQMLSMAGTLADRCSGELQIVSCWNYEYEEFLRHNPWAPVPEDKIRQAVKNSQSDHLSALEKLIEQAGKADRKKNHIQQLRGSPDTLIPQFVEDKDIDILVMGTLARTGIPGFTIGNTAENIVQKLSCSLLALKPQSFVSPVKA